MTHQSTIGALIVITPSGDRWVESHPRIARFRAISSIPGPRRPDTLTRRASEGRWPWPARDAPPVPSLARRVGMGTTVALVVYFLPVACFGMTGFALADPPQDVKSRDVNAERLKFMKDSVEVYEFTRGKDHAAALKLQPDPAFRLGKQGDGVVLEGAIFLWADEVGRPGAAAQVFLVQNPGRPGGEWRHEFTSLSTGPFTASQAGNPRWMPMVSGVSFQPIPGAPKPADKPQQRLRQMRDLAAEFHAEDDFWGRGWNALRLLPTPISRYGKAGGTPEDGALFAFVLGTDPESFLFIEARKGAAGLEWQYAFAPMTCWALKAEHKSRPVWNLPQRNSGNPFRTFYSRVYQP